jgi:hypothetical protein
MRGEVGGGGGVSARFKTHRIPALKNDVMVGALCFCPLEAAFFVPFDATFFFFTVGREREEGRGGG